MTVQDSSPVVNDRLLHQLNLQSGQINRVFDAYNLPAEVSGGVVRQRTVRFDLQTHLNGGLDAVRGLKGELMAALGVRDISLGRDGGQWHVHVERVYEPAVPLLKLLASSPRPPAGTTPIGLRGSGQAFNLTFGFGAASHILVSGETGTGKTSLLRSLAAGLSFVGRQSDLQLVIIDAAVSSNGRFGSKESLRPLAYLPHMLTDPVNGTPAGLGLLHFLVEEMEHRRREHVVLPRIIVLVDHLVLLLEQGGATAREVVIRLLQHGSEVGIHLVLATARPDSSLIDTPIRMNLPMRLVGKARDATAARLATGMDETYAEYLLCGGDFLAVAGENVTRFQAAYIGDYDLHLRLSQLYATPRPRLLAQPFINRPQLIAPEKSAEVSMERPFSVQNGAVRLAVNAGAELSPLPFFDEK